MLEVLSRRSGAGRAVRLGLDGAEALDEEMLGAAGLIARTLIAAGPLTVTLIALAPGEELPPHRAVGPVALHVLDGALEVRAGAAVRQLGAGELLSFVAGEEHAVTSPGGARFLLTLADPGACPAQSQEVA